LGAEIIVDGTFDRQIIASKVFNHKDRLEALEALIHPAVREDISKQFKEVAALGVHPLFVAEIPLLFEAGFEYEYDYTAAIIADEAECQRRFQAARGYDGEEYARRASRQWSPQEKAAKADFVIPNGGDENQLKHAVRELYEKIVT
jgi:dephospho-CoA kinase